MKRTLFTSLIAACTAMLLPSCNSSESTGTDSVDTQYDIVTYAALSKNGSSFTVQKDDNSTPVTLTTTQSLDTTYVKVGERVLIAYTLPDGVSAYTSSSITLVGYKPIINDVLTTGSYDSTGDYQTIYAAWPTGNYLNIHADASFANEPKKYSLELDQLTANNEYPTVYLNFKTDRDDQASTNSIYASFDISELRANSNVRGITLVWMPKSGTGTGSTVINFGNSNSEIQPIDPMQ